MCLRMISVSYAFLVIQHKDDGHYPLPLPFKNISSPLLPNNKKLAIARLQHLKKKLKSNQQYYESYKAFMEEMFNKGDAEPAPMLSKEEIAWY